jgi:hypothetical protein
MDDCQSAGVVIHFKREILMINLTTIRTFDNYVTAHIIKAKLETEGIEAVLIDENTVTMQWHIANAIGGIKLKVAESDIEHALHILETTEQEAIADSQTPGFWDEEDIDQLNPDNRICIHCGSQNTRKDDYDKKPAILSWLLLGFPLFFKSDKWHCFHCGKKF